MGELNEIAGLAETAQLFKVLGNESRLALLYRISKQESSVGQLTDDTGLSQPLVSQHLRTLRDAGLVRATRHGKEVIYSLRDRHVEHIISDARHHVLEDHSED